SIIIGGSSMVFVFFVLWTITAILLATNPKNPSTRWVAFTTFAAGGGGLSRTISETIFPYLAKHEIGNLLVNTFLHKTQIAASFMNHVVTPFCFLMFAITYSGIFTRYKRYLFFILAMPILY